MTPVRRSLMTAVPIGVIAAMSTLALAMSAVMDALTRDRDAVQAGQWWRTMTPILLQPSGFAALVFLLVGLAALTPPLVARFGGRRVVAGMVIAGLVPLALSTWLDPGDRSGGSSDVVAGLVGMWAVATVVAGSVADRSWRSVLASGYGAFFTGYLAALASPLAVAAPLIGNAAAAVAVVAHRRFGRPDVAGGLIIGGGLLMTALLDDHGFGIVVGIAVGGSVRGWLVLTGSAGATFGRIPMLTGIVAAVFIAWTSAYGIALLSWSTVPAVLVVGAVLLLVGPGTSTAAPPERHDAGHVR